MASPEAIELRFTAAVTAPPDAVRLRGSDGKDRRLGEVVFLGGSRKDLSFPIAAELTPGRYDVTWRAISKDGHPLSGAFSFIVNGAPGEQPATPDDTTPPETTDPPDVSTSGDGNATGSRAVGVLFGVARLVSFAALTTLIGFGAAVMILTPSTAQSKVAQRWLISAASVLAVTTAIAFGLGSAYAAGVGLEGAIDPELLRLSMSTSFGKAMVPRLGVAIAAVFVVRLLPGLPALAGGVAAALLLFTSLSGHASTGASPALAVALDVIHLGAASLWLGGLVALLAVVLPSPAGSRRVVRRFSTLATVAVLIVAVTGAARGWREIGSVGAILDADYGRLVVAKVVLFGVVLVLASFARRAARRGLDSDESEEGPGFGVGLRRIVVVEAAIGLAVLAVTAVLVIAAPPRSIDTVEVRESGVAYTNTAHTRSTQVDVRLEPASAGDNSLEVRIGNHSGETLDVPEVRAVVTSLDGSSRGISASLSRTGPGVWQGSVTIPARGRWELSVSVQREAASAESAKFTVIVL